MENENEKVVPINISNKMIKNVGSYKKSDDYKNGLEKDQEELKERLKRLRKIQQNLYMAKSNEPNNEFFRNNRIIQQKIYEIEDELFKIKQTLRDFNSKTRENAIQVFGDMGTLPIVRGRVGSNDEERTLENEQEQLKHNKYVLKKRGPLLPITGKRQTTLGEFYSTKPNSKRLRTEGGSKKRNQKRKSRTMKKRK